MYIPASSAVRLGGIGRSRVAMRGSVALSAAVDGIPFDCGPAAHSFFGSLRVSAALVAAATIKEAFVLQDGPADIKKSQGWTLLRHTYLLLMMLAFASEVLCVFVCTFAIVVFQAANVDTRAVSVIALLLRELEYEYVAARCHFVTGVFGFLISQALRLRLVLRKSPNLSKFAMLQLLHTACAMVTYNNGRGAFHHVVYGGYMGVSRRFLILHTEMLFSRCRAMQPLALLAIASFVLSAGFASRMFCNLIYQKYKSNTTDLPPPHNLATFCTALYKTSYGLLRAVVYSCIPFINPPPPTDTEKPSQAPDLDAKSIRDMESLYSPSSSFGATNGGGGGGD